MQFHRCLQIIARQEDPRLILLPQYSLTHPLHNRHHIQHLLRLVPVNPQNCIPKRTRTLTIYDSHRQCLSDPRIEMIPMCCTGRCLPRKKLQGPKEIIASTKKNYIIFSIDLGCRTIEEVGQVQNVQHSNSKFWQPIKTTM